MFLQKVYPEGVVTTLETRSTEVIRVDARAEAVALLKKLEGMPRTTKPSGKPTEYAAQRIS